MSNIILQKYRTLQPVNGDGTVHDLLQILVEMPPKEYAKFYGHSRHAGRFYLFRHGSEFGKVIEYVPDADGDTSVTTLYLEHPIFESVQTLVNAREEIIREIDSLLLAVPNTAAVKDQGRNKLLKLPELGTAQLLEVLATFTGSSVKAV